MPASRFLALLCLLLCFLLALASCSDDPLPPAGNATGLPIVTEENPLPPLFENALYKLRYTVNLASRERLYKPDGKGGLFFEDDILHAQQPYPGVTDNYVESEQPELRVYFIAHWPSVGMYEVDAPIEHAVARMLGKFLGSSALNSLPRGGTGKTPHERDPEDDDTQPTWYLPIYPLVITYEVGETPGGAVSVSFRFWSYGGGAHDNWTYASCNLMRPDGEKIKLQRIFPNQESLEKAAAYFMNYGLVAYEGEERDISIDVDPDDIAMERLILVPEGLDILFAPYEKASFAFGDIRLRIPLAEFKVLGMSAELWRAPE